MTKDELSFYRFFFGSLKENKYIVKAEKENVAKEFWARAYFKNGKIGIDNFERYKILVA
jgi:hypothetical protein